MVDEKAVNHFEICPKPNSKEAEPHGAFSLAMLPCVTLLVGGAAVNGLGLQHESAT